MAYIEAKPQTWFFSIDVNFDEIGIWNRALSDLELQAVYDAGLSGTPLPEPATLVVLGLGGLAVLIRRKR